MKFLYVVGGLAIFGIRAKKARILRFSKMRKVEPYPIRLIGEMA